MNCPHPDIADKRFDYVNFDEAFIEFAEAECDGKAADVLMHELEQTVLLRHHEAIVCDVADHPRTIWQLTSDDLIFRYQVLAESVEVGGIRSKLTGVSYEPKHDLMAEFTR